jgi:para-nitrobenzyl esterase
LELRDPFGIQGMIMTIPRSVSRLAAGLGAAALVGFVVVASAAAQQRPGPKQGTARRAAVAGPRVVANAKTAVVGTQYGDLRGFIHDGIYNYKGVQYARSERFQAPVPPERWTGVRTALSDVKVCPIDLPTLLPDELEFAQAHHWGFETEDCLRLNVWTPGVNDGGKRPVMVWLHGGGYSGGSSIELPFYDGENLARTGDVVVVSVNHRLNVLGFLDLSAYGEKYSASGNVGMVDLVAALKWVSGNIAGFGGDPGNVMIFGQSGGGGKVSTLLAAPSAKGLFHKAAVQSGSLTTFGDQKNAREVAAELLAALDIQPAQVDNLQKVPYRQLMAAANTALRKVRERQQKAGSAAPGGMGLGWGPVLDGTFLPYQGNDPQAIAISKDVPVLVGSNLTEFTSSAMRGASAAEVDAALAKRYGTRKDAYVQAFKKAHPTLTAPEYMVQVDTTFRPGVVKQASARAQAKAAPVYVYLFAWESPVLDGYFKSVHCLEIPFVFNSIDFAQYHTGAGPEAYALAAKVSKAWVTFARTGNPNHPGLPAWPAFSPESGATMVLNSKSEVRKHLDREFLAVVSQ